MPPDQNAPITQQPSTQNPPVLPPQDPQLSAPQPSNLYPIININRPEKPNRFYAIPLIGILIKIIILIPVGFWLGILGIGGFFVSIINATVVLFSGKYWKVAYNYNLGLMRLYIKTAFFVQGLTDKYPGLNRTINDNYSVDVSYPEHSSRLFAIPLIGALLRIILLIPYFIFQNVLSNASNAGVVISFFPVLFMGKYPESTFELARDSVRVSQGTFVYMSGISDKYPSFKISWNHKIIKIILIIIGALLFLGNTFGNMGSQNNSYKLQQNPYTNTLNNNFP